jgi:hypothetical protein
LRCRERFNPGGELMRGLIERLILLLLIVAVDFGAYIVVSTAQLGPLRAAQADTQARFGDKLSGCGSLKAVTASAGRIPAGAKLVVVDSKHTVVYQDYQAALPTEAQAKDQNDATVIACLTEKLTYVATEQYGSPTDSTRYSCVRNRRDFSTALVDFATGQTLSSGTIQGPKPPECPDKTDSNLTRNGDLPAPDMVSRWLTGKINK